MDDKLSILVLIDNFLPNISQAIRAVDNYAQRLNVKHDVVVATMQDLPEDLNTNYIVIESSSVSDLYHRLKKAKFDIIHIHSFGKIFKLAKKLAKVQNVPVVASVHNNEIATIRSKYGLGAVSRNLINKLIKKYNSVDELFVSSPFVAEELRLNGFEGKVSYLPLGSDLNINENGKELVEFVNAKYKLSKVKNVLVSMGNVVVTKRIGFALQALRIIKEHGIDFQYFIIGPGDDIPRLQSLAEYLGIGDRVHFLGYTTDDITSALLARADLLLYPSTYDYYGLAKIESAGFATAGVYIRDSFVASEVFDEINGYVASNNEISFAKVIENALADKSTLREVSKTARKDLYVSWKKCTDMLSNRLVGVIEEKIGLTKKLKKEQLRGKKNGK